MGGGKRERESGKEGLIKREGICRSGGRQNQAKKNREKAEKKRREKRKSKRKKKKKIRKKPSVV